MMPRLLLTVLAALALAAAVFVIGRSTPSMGAAMALTAAFFLAAALIALLLTRGREQLRAPLAVAFVVVGIGAGVVLGLPSLRDKEVSETVAKGMPARQAGKEGRERRANVELAGGKFEPLAHAATGRATYVRLAGGGTRLTLTDFEIDNGPDLRVYLVPGPVSGDADVEGFVDIGALKGNKGDQQYVIPEGVDTHRFGTVVIWCRAFTVGFGKAELEPS